ncbi:MAG TPA: DUF3467 domain-containing protein [Anaerolineae bacterium]|nr:DUF3467 domain-containing protein [Anaerolineae bacterium]HIP72586.1 DUF3467 domain-containing protein [Anaerolineae bacterium]
MNENPKPNPPQPEPAGKQKRITIDMPKNLSAVYSNVAFMRYTPAEILIDFAQVLPGTPRGQILARIIMSPMHAKMLQRALADNIAKYERQFGEIRMPTPLADQFFRFPKQDDDDDDEK